MIYPSDCFFFFNDTATTEIYTLSLHDALPICAREQPEGGRARAEGGVEKRVDGDEDRKSTRLNSSHLVISYAVFCLKKKKKNPPRQARSKKTRDTTTRRTGRQPNTDHH